MDLICSVPNHHKDRHCNQNGGGNKRILLYTPSNKKFEISMIS